MDIPVRQMPVFWHGQYKEWIDGLRWSYFQARLKLRTTSNPQTPWQVVHVFQDHTRHGWTPSGVPSSPRHHAAGSSRQQFQGLQPSVDAYKYAFFPRTIPVWHALPVELVEAESLEAFKLRVCTLQSLHSYDVDILHELFFCTCSSLSSLMHCFRIARSAIAVHCDYRVSRHPLEDTQYTEPEQYPSVSGTDGFGELSYFLSYVFCYCFGCTDRKWKIEGVAGVEYSVLTMEVVASRSKSKLLYCFLGIFVSYFIYGILQENMWVCIVFRNFASYTLAACHSCSRIVLAAGKRVHLSPIWS